MALFPSSSSYRIPPPSFLKPTFATILLLLSLYAFFNTFLFPISPSFSTPPHDTPSLSSLQSFSLLSTDAGRPRLTNAGGVVKIFMYDLPKKFTFGVIENYLLARRPDGNHDPRIPEEELKYPGNQHSAEWYLFKDLLSRGAESGSQVGPTHIVRVFYPSEADLFYVPFFSSLSLVVNPMRSGGVGGGVGVYSDEGMQEGLVEWLEGEGYWRRNNGRDHVFICQDPNALYKVMDKVKNGVLLVSDFGRLGGDQASLVKDVVLPYSHRINSFKGEVGVDGRKSLLFFMGNRYRKEVVCIFI